MSSCCDKSKDEVKQAVTPCCDGENSVEAKTGCCEVEKQPASTSCCGSDDGESKAKPDYLLRISGSIVLVAYLVHLIFGEASFLPAWLDTMAAGTFELVNKMWWGIIAAVLFVGLLDRIPRDLVMSALGQGGTFRGILRATLAGVLLDLCSHGILMVGTKLYERGASIGQVMAFLIASPWNSLSLTIILISLIGFSWTLAFIVLSMAIGVGTGLIFDRLVSHGTLPASPHQSEGEHESRPVVSGLVGMIKSADYSATSVKALVLDGVKGSRMVFRWLFFGLVLATAIRAFVPMDTYQNLFGPTLAGLLLTTVFATIIEVCSEGSTPIAADLVTRAAAPGNGFTFLMAGVATDYTEVMVIKDTTRSWKLALFLPLVSLPQVLVIGFILNQV